MYLNCYHLEETMVCLLWVFTVLIGLGLAARIFLKLWFRQNGSYTCLVGKTVIVTGANTGIGYYTALDFAKRGARVILACRNKDRAEEAQRKIIEATNNPNVLYKLIDLSSLKSVREFAKNINTTEDRLDILVNNAGACGLGSHITQDGLQLTMQINHFAPFLLTHLLLDKLKSSAPSRIVNVSSYVAVMALLDVNKINEFPGGGTIWANTIAYNNTKLCNVLFTIELAKRISGTGVTANTLHPGIIDTDLIRRLPFLMKKVVEGIVKLYFRTSEEGAQTTIYVALAKELDGVSGRIFDNCREAQIYWTAKDEDLIKSVWEKSEELTQLSENEKIK